MITFVNSLFLYFAALNIQHTTNFIGPIIFMLALNIIWLPIQNHISKESNSSKLPILDWEQMNSITFAAIVALSLYATRSREGTWIGLSLFFILASRSIIDYGIGWKKVYTQGFDVK
jgi:hypothetical protein